MSAESKQQKQAVIDEIKGKLDGAQSAVIVDYIGITVEQADELRKNLREANVDYTVYKNTLIKRAIDGTEFEPLKDDLEGPTALAISKDDATAPARVLSKSIKDFQKMAFKAGIVEGKYYDKEGIEAISKIPSREELLAKFLGSIKSPVSKFARRSRLSRKRKHPSLKRRLRQKRHLLRKPLLQKQHRRKPLRPKRLRKKSLPSSMAA